MIVIYSSLLRSPSSMSVLFRAASMKIPENVRPMTTNGPVSAETPWTGQFLTNSLTRRKEQIVMAQPPILRWYSCGPTVYDSAHLGHAYSYVQFDLIRRVLEDFRGLNVVQVMNITDIDDKIIAKANQTGTDWRDVSRKYEEEFAEDLRSLKIRPPTVTARVTDFLPQIVEFIQRLLKAGLAYVAPSGSVYFDLDKYGRGYKFVKFSEPEKFDRGEKKSAEDFALWKGVKPNEPSWPVPFSSIPGRPGWHIECPAVASHYFGSSIDLHSGGTDLMFPHHENEEAQCCAFHNVDSWTRQWIHTGHVLAPDERKMSKSDKNFVTIRDYLDRFDADQFRMFCMRHHYRSHCIYDEEEIRVSTDMISKFTNFSNTVDAFLNGAIPATSTSVNEPEIFQQIISTESAIKSALSDDFDFPSAINAILQLVSFCHKQLNSTEKYPATSATSYSAIAAAANLSEAFFSRCGLILPSKRNSTATVNSTSSEAKTLPKVMDAVLDFRSGLRQGALAARKESPELAKLILQSCDGVRDRLNKSGVKLKDLPGGSTWELDQPVVTVPRKAGIK